MTLPGEASETSEYNLVGNLVKTINATTMETDYQYDVLDRLQSVTEAGEATAGYTYDAHDNVKTVTDADNKATSFTSDDFGRKIFATAPDTGLTDSSYDAAGNLVSVTDAKEQTITYAYDALNRPISQSYAGGDDILFSYDQGENAIGRLSRITDREGTDTFSYDTAGRLVTETRVIGPTSYTIGYSWDAATGELAGMTYPSGLSLSYTRDAAGQISAINMDGAALVSAVSHLPFGPLKSATLGSVSLTRDYDQRYNVARITAGSLDYGYTRDAGGNVTNIAGIQVPTTAGEATDYSYNPANNQLTAAAPKAYSYDANGNMTSDGTFTFVYDTLNRLVKVENQGATVASYGYDSANRRISKTVGETTTHYLYDLNSQLIAETLLDGTPLREYIYLDGEPLALREYETNPGTYYFINDHLGTPQQLVTATGTMVWQAAYLPFGQAQIKVQTVQNNLRFPGQYYDAETGLHYNWNRFYDPETGRYISADPIGLAGGMNLYAYVQGDPVNLVDPMGLEEFPDTFIGPLPRNGYRTSEMMQTKCGKVPPAPPGADIDANMKLADNNWYPVWFYNQVRNGGPWDYKQSGSKYEDFGNFNFGATGSAFGFPSGVLKRGAGWANQRADPTRTALGSPYGRYPYGDAPQDQDQIDKGIIYCECMEY